MTEVTTDTTDRNESAHSGWWCLNVLLNKWVYRNAKLTAVRK